MNNINIEKTQTKSYSKIENSKPLIWAFFNTFISNKYVHTFILQNNPAYKKYINLFLIYSLVPQLDLTNLSVVYKLSCSLMLIIILNATYIIIHYNYTNKLKTWENIQNTK